MLSRALWLVAVVAAVAAWYWFQRGSSPPSPGRPPAETSLTRESEPMVPPSRPEQVDSQRANEPPPTRPAQIADGRTIYMCHYGLLMKKTLEERNCDAVPADDVGGQQMCLNGIAAEFAELQRLTAKTAACPQSLTNPSDYYDALRDAALSGDLNAERCFLAGYFNDMRAEHRISKAQYDEYPALARKFFQSALERGDWAVVHHLADSYVDDPGLLYRDRKSVV